MLLAKAFTLRALATNTETIGRRGVLDGLSNLELSSCSCCHEIFELAKFLNLLLCGVVFGRSPNFACLMLFWRYRAFLIITVFRKSHDAGATLGE
jgi:hypothetical protein